MDRRSWCPKLPAGEEIQSESKCHWTSLKSAINQSSPAEGVRTPARGREPNRKMALTAFYLNEMMQDSGNNKSHTFCG
jgi:hypothetical protein